MKPHSPQERLHPTERPRCVVDGKVKFTANEARAVIVGATIARGNGNARRQERRTYACHVCGWHHVSSHEEPPEGLS